MGSFHLDGVFPPPLWGRVREGGREVEHDRLTPTPNPSLQGGGEQTADAASASLTHFFSL